MGRISVQFPEQVVTLLLPAPPLLNAKKEKNTDMDVNGSFVSYSAELILIGYNKIVGISMSSPFRAQPFTDRYIVGAQK